MALYDRDSGFVHMKTKYRKSTWEKFKEAQKKADDMGKKLDCFEEVDQLMLRNIADVEKIYAQWEKDAKAKGTFSGQGIEPVAV